MSPLEQFMVLEKRRVVQRAKLYTAMVVTGMLLLLLCSSFVWSTSKNSPSSSNALVACLDSLNKVPKEVIRIDTLLKIDTVRIEDNSEVDELWKKINIYNRRVDRKREQIKELELALIECQKTDTIIITDDQCKKDKAALLNLVKIQESEISSLNDSIQKL